jgi:hypothetical protein
MAGRKIRDAAEARAFLAAVEESGLERAEWARRRGLDARSLNAWRLNLGGRRRSEVVGSRLRLVELTVAPPASSARYVVHLGDIAVELDNNFDDGTLRRLLDVLGSC